MKKKNPNSKPIFYKETEIDKPVHELIEQLRKDAMTIRGKLGDIRHIYGWPDRFEHLEGGLTCMIVAMNHTQEEIKKYELKYNV